MASAAPLDLPPSCVEGKFSTETYYVDEPPFGTREECLAEAAESNWRHCEDRGEDLIVYSVVGELMPPPER